MASFFEFLGVKCHNVYDFNELSKISRVIYVTMLAIVLLGDVYLGLN